MTAHASSPPEIEAVRRKAAGSSFYSAMRLMPKPEREAMYAIYAFCRAVDDIADDGLGTRAERHAALDQWRSGIGLVYDSEKPQNYGPSLDFGELSRAALRARKEPADSVKHPPAGGIPPGA